MTIHAFLNRHPPTEHPYLEEIHAAIADRACDSSAPRSFPSEQLLGSFQKAAGHLERFSTQHTTALLQDIQAFCQQLEVSPEAFVSLWQFRCAGHLYVFAERTDTFQLLSAFRQSDRLVIDAETWEDLFGVVLPPVNTIN